MSNKNGKQMSTTLIRASNEPAVKQPSLKIKVPSTRDTSPPDILSPEIIGKHVNLIKNWNAENEEGAINARNTNLSQHGWTWEGKPYFSYILTKNMSAPHLRLCYPAIRHLTEGDVIKIKDDVFICSDLSSPTQKLKRNYSETSFPFLAKVVGFWNHNGEMKVTLLWYYQKDQVEINDSDDESIESIYQEYDSSFTKRITDRDNNEERKHDMMENKNYPLKKYGCPREVYASRHIDTLSVGCIEDKAYVLTYDSYCRFNRQQKFHSEPRFPISKTIVPPASLESQCNTKYNFQMLSHNAKSVFFCRKIYDPLHKRLIKNPTFKYS